MIFKSIVRATVFSILLLGVTSNGWGSPQEDLYSDRISRRGAPNMYGIRFEEAEHRKPYNQTCSCVISAINWLAPAIIVFYSAYLAYLNGIENKS